MNTIAITDELYKKQYKLHTQYIAMKLISLFSLNETDLILFRVIPLLSENEFKRLFKDPLDFLLVFPSHRINNSQNKGLMYFMVKCTDKKHYNLLNRTLPKCLWVSTKPCLSIDIIIDMFQNFILLGSVSETPISYFGLYLNKLQCEMLVDYIDNKLNSDIIFKGNSDFNFELVEFNRYWFLNLYDKTDILESYFSNM